MVRRRRDEHTQASRSVLARSSSAVCHSGGFLPETLKYTRRNGRFFLEIVGNPDYGVPFGQDRLVLLSLATAAVRAKSPVVRFGSAGEILGMG